MKSWPRLAPVAWASCIRHYTVNGSAFVAGKPRVLFTVNGVRGIDMAADGRRLMAVVPTVIGPAPKAEHTIIFVQNFFDELRRRVPIRR
jgi:hypothetical protein